MEGALWRRACARAYSLSRLRVRTASSSPAHRQTVDSLEAEKFNYSDWWSVGGSAQPLHALNRVRVPLVRNAILGRALNDLSPLEDPSPYPLEGKRVLDVGCGAGVLCEPLARLGAEVTGIDPSPSNIVAASTHSSQDREVAGRLEYLSCSVEELCGEQRGGQFDAVIASEVVEHVADLKQFIAELTTLVKPAGLAVFTTINRTPASFLLAILAAEYILRVLPQGSHEWNKFVTPDELSEALRAAGMEPRFTQGTSYNPFTNQWEWSWSAEVNYALVATKL